MRKKATRWWAILLFLAALLTLSGCDPMAGLYPFQVSEKWVCDDPSITLVDRYDRETNQSTEEEWIRWNGNEVRIRISYQGGSFWVSEYHDGVLTSDTLFRGTWRYRGDKLVLTIEEDNFFGGAYETLIFSKADA